MVADDIDVSATIIEVMTNSAQLDFIAENLNDTFALASYVRLHSVSDRSNG